MKFEQYKFLRQQLLEQLAQQARPDTDEEPATLVLAYLGDAVFALYVKQRLIAIERSKVRVLNDVNAKMVSAVLQAKALAELLPVLSEQEAAVVRRGRNTKASVPRSASVSEYRQSTGLECLFGWLYWQKDDQRLLELMGMAFAVITACLLAELAAESGR